MKQISDQLGSVQLQMEFVELKGLAELQREFRIKDVVDFWKLVGHLPNISRLARGIISMFLSTYQCEAAFSALSKIKHCSRNILSLRHTTEALWIGQLQIPCVAEGVSEIALSKVSTALPAVNCCVLLRTVMVSSVLCVTLLWNL